MSTVHDLAMLLVSKIVGTTSPFYKYRETTEVLSEIYRDVFNAGIWGYQLVVYLRIIREKFGGDVCGSVRQYQLNVLDPEFEGISLSAQEAAALSTLNTSIKLIDEAMRFHVVNIPQSDVVRDISVELSIARVLLQDDPVSPDFAKDEYASRGVGPDDRVRVEDKFAHYLYLGAKEVRSEYIPVIEAIE